MEKRDCWPCLASVWTVDGDEGKAFWSSEEELPVSGGGVSTEKMGGA